MKKGLITAIIVVLAIGVGVVAYDKVSTQTVHANEMTNTENGTNTSNQQSVGNSQNANSNNESNSSNATQNNQNNQSNQSNQSNQGSQVNQSNVNSQDGNSKEVTENNKDANTNTQSKVSKKSTKPLFYGQQIPGTNKICHDVIEEGGVVYPKNAQGFFWVNKEIKSSLTEGNITISASTPYVQYSGEDSLFNYYILKSYNLNDGDYKTTKTLNKLYPDKTNFNEEGNNLTAIGYIQGGVIVANNSNGDTVYVSAKSIKSPVIFERGDVQYFEANAVVNVNNPVQVRAEPAGLPTFDTIGNQITQNGLKVVATAQVNNYTRIIFGTSGGLFSGWVPTSSLNIENYS